MPLLQPPVTERSIRDEAAHGEQESSRRVTGSSRALIGLNPGYLAFSVVV